MPRFEATMGGGNPDYKLVLYTSNTGTTVHASLYWMRAGSSSYSSFNGGAAFNLVIAGVSVASGGYNFNAPAGGSIGETYIAGGSRDVGAVGAAWVAGYFNTDTAAAGYGEVGGGQSVATTPPAPTMLPLSEITATSMKVTFSGNGDGGAPITRWEYQYALDAGFTTGVSGLFVSSGTSVQGGLDPTKTYYFRARGVNGVGAGAWSNVVSATTLAATAPTLAVTAAISGTSAVATFTPSSSQPSPDAWVLERRVQGSGVTVPTTFLTSPQTITGLSQGTVYEWRLAAKNGSYTSPFTAWLAIQQPNPNTSAGDFFDGSSAATGDAAFSWRGTVDKSISDATGVGVEGWTLDVSAPLTARLYRQLGGRSQSHSARIVVISDGPTSTGGGLRMRTVNSALTRAEVAEGGIYYGSVHVQMPGRSQRLAASIDWLDSAGSVISGSAGTPAVIPQDSGAWTRVVVSGTAPFGAKFALLRISDVTGTGWAQWRGGDVVVVDDAMISLGDYQYFDGNTTDTPTTKYDWLLTENASASTATAHPSGDSDFLEDPDCPPVPAPPRPPYIEDECIEPVGTWRRYWAVIPAENVNKWLASIPTILLTSGAYPTRQARIRLYANPDELPPTSFIGTTEWESEQIVSYIPPGVTFVLDGVSQRARATLGSESRPADHMLFGTGGGPASWPTLECGVSYVMSVDVPTDSPSGNLSVQVALTPRM